MTAGLELSLGSKTNTPSAEWRLPHPEEQIGVNRRENLWQRVIAWLFLVCGCLFLFLVVKLEPSPIGQVISFFKAAGMIAISQASLIYLLNRISNRVKLGPGLKRIRAKVPTEAACPVGIELRQRQTVSGADEGYMWLEDGTLFYKGIQTAFRLNASDIEEEDNWPARRRPDVAAGKMPSWLPVKAGSGHVEITIRLIDPFEDFHTRRRAHRFQSSLGAWLHERPAGSLETVLPPLGIHPSLIDQGRLHWEGVATGIAMTAVNVVCLLAVRPQLDVASATGALSMLQLAGALALLYFSVRFTWQQKLDITNRRALFLEEELNRPV